MNMVLNFCGYVACGFLAALAATVIVFIWQNKIDLRHLLSEANGQASMSRFQLMIFTFVVAIGMFELIEKVTPAGFPEIPNGVLTLLGISASTYAIGKGISYSQPDLLKAPGKADAEAAQKAAEEAEAHANAAKNSADSSKTSADKSAGHMAAAQQAADRATGA